MKATKRFYGFEYWDGYKTTTGQPNKKTGRMSTAGDLAVFSSKALRDQWITEGARRARAGVSSSKARDLCAGMSVAEYAEHLTWICDYEILDED